MQSKQQDPDRLKKCRSVHSAEDLMLVTLKQVKRVALQRKGRKKKGRPASKLVKEETFCPICIDLRKPHPPQEIFSPLLSFRERNLKNAILSNILNKFKFRPVKKESIHLAGLQIKKVEASERRLFSRQSKLTTTRIKSDPDILANRIEKNTVTRVAVKKERPISESANRQILEATKVKVELPVRNYDIRLQLYLQFLLKLQFVQGIRPEQPKNERSFPKLRAYVGLGNNSNLVKSLIKRKFWWVLTEDRKEADFVWTQLRVLALYDQQTKVPFEGVLIFADGTQQKSNQNLKIMGASDCSLYGDGSSSAKTFTQRVSRLCKRKTLISYKQVTPIHNHFPKNFIVGNKKALFTTLKEYYGSLGRDPYQVLPLTFHIEKGAEDKEYSNFLQYFKQLNQEKRKAGEREATWIVKPGEKSNRGSGIRVIQKLSQLQRIFNSKEKHPDGTSYSYIVQLYIERPLLYCRRKFDIRHYLLITRLRGKTLAYFSTEGYIRTSSYEFNLSQLDCRLTHLTNDAVQKGGEDYGRYQPANKLSYYEFNKYLEARHKEVNFFRDVLPRMRQMAVDISRAACPLLSPCEQAGNFQLFGLDFMLDQGFRLYLIEVNTNPCLQLACPLLQRVIPTLLEQALRLSLDVLHPPPVQFSKSARHMVPDCQLSKLKWQLIFDQAEELQKEWYRRWYRRGKELRPQQCEEEEQLYEDEGTEVAQFS